MQQAATMFEKIWADHVIVAAPEGEDLLYVDLNFMNEGGAFLAFDQLRLEGRKVHRPLQNIPITDHYIPTTNRHLGIPGIPNPEIRHVVEMQDNNARDFGLPHIHMNHPNQGIAHVVAPELGLALPGMLITCNDSHTATNGALGAVASPIGASMQLRHVLATQTVWLKKPKTMRIELDGPMPFGVSPKDVILSVIRDIGIGGATGYCVEYAGSAIRTMSMEGRLTICNMSIEAGARLGMIAPDDTTFSYLADRPLAPKGAAWDSALAYWKTLPSDDEATFDRNHRFDVASLAPLVSWGTSPEDCASIDDVVPDPASITDTERRSHTERALQYMNLDSRNPPVAHCDRPRVHRLMHEQPDRGPARRGGGSQGAARLCSRDGFARLDQSKGAGGSRGTRPDFRRRRPRVAGCRMLDVQWLERRVGGAGRTLRVDHKPEFRGASGAQRAHAHHEPGHGRRRRRRWKAGGRPSSRAGRSMIRDSVAAKRRWVS